ncbi:similar to Saccharomyces cerevisiae YER111C SWI4 DNA binding component of the SBF complex (Swi4p-Swi6p) [Maudiozyma saulgeensis]|uniref:Similar to Saccharomyces cerevisiae YER111C SWI4 DNA binding component of the SBF complex (Swi4p-Swi6p) n=1 Tax=Maudiozyma saulgeensis TaxID=1789683 RepID=A0A1X7R4M5_9SACH|nr:similar to Saccharomyces cerevisiae YER111C SWI4 DNA binding component of the SBF complex (Swi4p-Swi6p) [Kazachstania saulgeensis]
MPYTSMLMDSTNEDESNQMNNNNQTNMMIHTQIPTITTTKVEDINNHQNNKISNNNNNTLHQLQPPHPNMKDPIIEIATYAETDVFECYIRGIESHIVMRKVKDDWINLTQMFKIGNFSKNQRTKILEKESSKIQHEKVQGGYGRFQGTWVPLNDARIIAERYKINDPVVNTIVNFIPDPNNLPPKRTKNSILRKTSPGKKIASPSSYKTTPKRKSQYESNPQYLSSAGGNTNLNNNTASSNYKKLKKQNKNHSNIGANPSPLQSIAFQTPQQSYLSGHSANTINGGNFPNTGNSALMGTNSFGVTISGNSTISHISSNETPQTNGYSASQKPLQFYPVPTTLRQNNNNNNGNNSNNNSEYEQSSQNYQNHTKSNPTKSHQASFLTFVPDGPHTNPDNNDYAMEQYKNPPNGDNHISKNEMNDSNQQNIEQTQHFQNNMMEVQPIPPPPPTLNTEDYKNLILQTLSSEVNANDETYSLPVELFYPPSNFNIDFLVDDQGHTSLHWAAAMANIPLIQLLLNSNANALQCNSKGFNAVTKALFYNNNYKNNSFHSLLSALKICLISPDQNGRLPLHYLIELSVNKSKDPAIINSYTETLLQILSNENYSLLEMTLNCQDHIGNTPLHLAALNLNISLFNKLCLLGASTSILNIDKHSPVDILSSFNLIIPSNPKPQNTPEAPDDEQQEVLKSPNVKKTRKKIGKKKANNKKHSTKNENPSHENTLSTPMVDLKPHLTEDPTSSSLNMISVEDISSVDIFANPSIPMSSTVTKNYNKQNLLSPQGAMTPSKIPNINSPFPIEQQHSLSNEINGNVINNTGTIKKHNKVRKSTFLASPHFASLNENSRHFANLVSEDAISRETQSKLNEMANLTGVRKMVYDLNKMINVMTNNIEEKLGTVIDDTNNVKQELEIVNDRFNSVNRKSKEIYQSINIENVDKVENVLEEHISDNKQYQNQLEKAMERSQALKLAKIMHEEEQVEEEQKDNPGDAKEQLRLATLLSLLQLQRQSKMSKIQEMTSSLTTSGKIRKYGKLMGMGFEDLENKLDEIERDLKVEV